jgi:hypothetical protein
MIANHGAPVAFHRGVREQRNLRSANWQYTAAQSGALHTFRDCLDNFNKISTFTFFRVRLFSRRCVGRVDLKTLAVVRM